MELIKILVVEDEPFIAEEICNKLLEFGYEVLGPADNADSAIKEFERSSPDVVIMDIKLNGGVDGIDLAAKLLRTSPFSLIFLTSLADQQTLARAAKLSPANYLVKPFVAHQLFTSIEVALLNFSLGISPVPGTKETIEIPETIANKDHVYLREGRDRKKYAISEICFIEADGAYCNVHLKNGRILVQTLNMRRIWEEIGHPELMRTSRFSVVNVSHIQRVSGDKITVQGMEINLSAKYKEALLKRIGLSK